MSGDVDVSGLAELPVGPALGAALAALEPAALDGPALLAVLVAEDRQASHQQARRLAAMVELGRIDPHDPELRRRLDEVGPHAAGEIAAALSISTKRAALDLELGQLLLTRLPRVWAAFLAGELNWAKAAAFAEYLGSLTPEQADALCADLLPHAPGRTTGWLRDRLRRLVHDIDPDAARRRYLRRIQERAVVSYLDENGTMVISGEGLPADEAARACERLDRLAEAAKRAGHQATVAQLRADIFLDALNHRHNGLTDAEIVRHLLGRSRSEPGPEAPDTAAEREGVEVRLGLATAAGLDQRSGEIAGFGPVPAAVARDVVLRQCRGAEWRFAVLGADGRLALGGTTRRRPATGGAPGTCRGGVVELHVSAAELADLAGRAPEWDEVIQDVTRQYYRYRRVGLRRSPRSAERTRARFVRGTVAREVQMRDRSCCFPGCRRPARRSDLDHTVAHADGGATTTDNVGPLCWTHHRWKSNGWWTVEQTEPGVFRWISPLGREYRARGEPIRPPSAPESRPPPEADGRPPPGPSG